MNLEPIRALLELAEKATPGPWEVCRGFVRTEAGNPVNQPPVLKAEGMEVRASCLWAAECRDREAFYNPDGNSAFIAAARNSVPALSQLLEAVDNDHAKAALAAYDEYKQRKFRGEHPVRISGAYAEFQKQACLSVLLLHPEDTK